MIDTTALIERLKSWANGYISPSAKMDIDEALRIIISMDEQIKELTREIERLREDLEMAYKIEETAKPKKPRAKK